MSRKRAASPPEAPYPKRYLNAALAAQLENLRISKLPSATPLAKPNPFGVTHTASPFLHPPSRAHQPMPNANVSFGNAFAYSLQQTDPSTHTTTHPQMPDHLNSHASMVIDDDDDSLTQPGLSSRNVFSSDIRGDGDIIIVDQFEGDEKANEENRLIVYHPPVRSLPKMFSTLNARLPDGQFVFRNPRTNDWIFTDAQPEGMKRKLALVPWRGDTKRQLLEPISVPPTVIPMPWHNTPTQEPVSFAAPAPTNMDESMQIEEILGNNN